MRRAKFLCQGWTKAVSARIMQTEASPLESADRHARAKSDDLAQTCFGAPPGVGDCPGDNPEQNCCGRKGI